MNHGKVIVLAGKILLIVSVLLSCAAMAGEPENKPSTNRYIIELLDPPLAEYDGRALSLDGRRLEATIPARTGALKLDVLSPRSSTYLAYIDGRHKAFHAEANRLLGRQVKAARTYRLATNGLAMDLTEDEADALRGSPLVKSVNENRIERYQTDLGPEWIGAGPVWDGTAGLPAAEGEGIIVGIIDGGINWDHLSFSDNPTDGHTYSNPKGVTLGLCSDAEVACNDKLIGVWDFTEDDPGTDFVEEYTKGKDDDGHGSHVASTAAGNPVSLVVAGQGQSVHSGVAPHANIISYRVCYVPDPDTDDGGCATDAILDGIEQAIEDGVDVLNYSIGSSPFSPWTPGSSARAFLNARNAGIFIATSAGNDGPDPGSLGSPGNAPWMMAVANGTHNRVEGSLLQDFSGGSTTPPEPILGVSQTGGIGIRKIVHARDYGFALCGIGEAELAATCSGNTGASNPFAGQVFNGEIVVCDRGTYGRIEKGKNVQLAGAGGMILANTDEQGEGVTADAHCLPAVHIGASDGNVLRAWLDSGSNHQGSISGSVVTTLDSFGDLVSASSGRGPTAAPVADIMKPNVIAPGTDIRAAWYTGTATFARISGTSMSSPHIAGAAALLMSVHPDWGPDQVQSAIEMTATDEQVRDILGTPGTPHDGGAGRPQLDLAVNAGLYLPMNTTDFFQAAPGGSVEPRDLNLPGLQEDKCAGICRFTRTVRDQMGGASWTATPVGFPSGVDVSVSPSSFSLGNGASRDLDIEIKINDGGLIGSWVSGKVRLSANGSSDLYLTAMVYAEGGDLPNVLYFQEDRNGGWNTVPMDNIVAMPDATFTSGGLQPITRIESTLPQDPTDDDPYDGGEGVITHWHSLPQGALWVYAQTPASEAIDLDLFVGRDVNKDGKAQENEELCRSISSIDLERCDVYNEPPGDYWVLVQNWDASNNAGDDMTLLTAGIGPSGDKTLAASGPGITTFSEAFDLRISFDDFGATHGEEYLGAVGVGSSRNSPNNIGVIPIRINRNGYADPATFPLMDGRLHSLALPPGGSHDRIFIDVPPGADSLTITAQTREAANNAGLKLELARLSFDDGLSTPPFATAAGARPKLASANGSGSEGPSITVSGGDLQSGRWYAVLTNENGDDVSIDIQADLVFSGDPLDIQWGLWEPSSRPGLGQGFEYAPGRALVWYTYDEDGQPAWFISGAFDLNGNLWTADLLRVTNDGSKQQFDVVGAVSVAMLARNDAMFSWRLYGESGSDRMRPVTFATCPQINGEEQSYTGLWFRGVDGLGGASVMVNHLSQIQIHYLFDGVGMPRWLIAQDVNDTSPTNPVLPMLQFEGYCAICDKGSVTYDTVGVLERTFTNELAGSWSLEYDFIAPLAGSANRTDSIVKLTEVLDCD